MTRTRLGMAAVATLITIGMLLIVAGFIGTPRSYRAMGAGAVVMITGARALPNARRIIQGERQQPAD